MHTIIKKIIKKQGQDVITSKILVNCIDDEGGFSDVEKHPYKKILKLIIDENYSRKLLEIGAWNAEAEMLVRTCAQRSLIQEEGVLYVFACLAYGLGWLSKAPKVPAEVKKIKQQEAQKKAKEVEAAQKRNEEVIRKNAEEAAHKKAEIAKKRALEAERRAKDAEKKALEAEEALRKSENAARSRTKSDPEQIPAQEVSVTNIANFANAMRYLKELERTFEEISKSTKGQKAKWNRMTDALNTFPLPTAREELFTFAVSMHSKMSEKLGGDGESVKEAGAVLMTAYLSKYKECILKVKSLYPTDSVFANLLSTYDEDIKKAKSAIWWQKDHTTMWVILGLISIMLLGIVTLAIFGDGETIPESDNVEVIESVNGANDSVLFDLTSTMTEFGETLTEAFTDNAADKSSHNQSIEGKTGELIIPDDVTEIKRNAYKDRKDITSVVVGKNIMEIGENAFLGCENLTTVIINSNSIIGNNVKKGFLKTSSITMAQIFGDQVTTYIIGDGVTCIGSEAFAECANLQKVTFGNSITTIKNAAFRNCKNLMSVEIPNSVISLGYGAFSGCDNLTNVKLSDNMTEIDGYSFSGCRALKSITIPKLVRKIEDSAFYGCKSLKSVKIPNSVIKIGTSAFQHCESLESVFIPRSVCELNLYAFGDCYVLKKVTIANPAINIDPGAFGYSPYVTVRLPKSWWDYHNWQDELHKVNVEYY